MRQLPVKVMIDTLYKFKHKELCINCQWMKCRAGTILHAFTVPHPLAPRRHYQLGPDVHADLIGIVIDEVPDAVVGDAAEFRPFPKGANRGLLACRENSAQA
jgi:hypothetical protein